MYTVYLHKSPSNKVYIGITSKTVKERWFGKQYAYKNNPYFYAAIVKYGWNNFEHIILYENINKISAKLIEIDLIYYYKKVKRCYNITDGGEGFLGLRHDEAFKERLRQRSIGNTWASHPCLEDTKKKIGKANSKIVELYDPVTLKTIRTFESCHEAGKIMNVSFQNVSKSCCKGIKTKGFYFRYKQNN